MRKLIGIAREFQCRVDLLAIESTILEVPHLPGAFLEVIGRTRTEAFLANTSRERVPVEFGIVKPSSGSAAVDATLAKLGLDARRSLAFADARADKALYKAVLVQETVFLQAIQNVSDDSRAELASGELSLEL